jgi:hypothetical protein
MTSLPTKIRASLKRMIKRDIRVFTTGRPIFLNYLLKSSCKTPSNKNSQLIEEVKLPGVEDKVDAGLGLPPNMPSSASPVETETAEELSSGCNVSISIRWFVVNSVDAGSVVSIKMISSRTLVGQD